MKAEILRLIAGGLLGLLCCYGGVIIRRHYADREKFFGDAEQFALQLKRELGFRKTPLPDIIAAFSETTKGQFSKMLESFSRRLAAGVPQSEAARAEAEETKMKPADKLLVREFLSSLGKTALPDQLEAVQRAQESFAARRAVCAEETKRLGGMYFKLAVLLGIALIVLLA